VTRGRLLVVMACCWVLGLTGGAGLGVMLERAKPLPGAWRCADKACSVEVFETENGGIAVKRNYARDCP